MVTIPILWALMSGEMLFVVYVPAEWLVILTLMLCVF